MAPIHNLSQLSFESLLLFYGDQQGTVLCKMVTKMCRKRETKCTISSLKEDEFAFKIILFGCWNRTIEMRKSSFECIQEESTVKLGHS